MEPAINAPVPIPSQQSAAEPIPQSQPLVPASTPPVQASGGKNVMIPATAFRERLQGAKATGRKEYEVQLDKDAQALGYANHAAMMEILRSGAGHPRQQQAQARPANRPPVAQPNRQEPNQDPQVIPPKNSKDRKAWERQQARIRDLERQNRQAQEERAAESARRKKAERRAQAAEARANLERIAAGCGIKRIGQAIYLFEEAHRGKSVEELGQVDEAKFFEGLRQTDSYLFGETVVPATTGTSGTIPGAHVPPRPSSTSVAAGEAAQVDTMKMSEEEFALHQRKRGFRSVSSGGLG